MMARYISISAAKAWLPIQSTLDDALERVIKNLDKKSTTRASKNVKTNLFQADRLQFNAAWK